MLYELLKLLTHLSCIVLTVQEIKPCNKLFHTKAGGPPNSAGLPFQQLLIYYTLIQPL